MNRHSAVGLSACGRMTPWRFPAILVIGMLHWFGASVTAGTIEINGNRFTLPDGYRIQMVAGPPMVNRPICADFDTAGRLYVAESSGSNDPVEKQLADKPHRILRLVDTDGDGEFDQRTVFAEHLMFPEGVLWKDGSLYVAAPPQIWKFTDADDDGVAESRSVWFDGKTLTHCANDLHGPYEGPDGWIYWCKGAFAEQTYERNGSTWSTRASHIFRRRLGSDRLEPIMTGGMDNPVEVIFTRTGEPIFTTTFLQHPRNGKRDGLIHAVYGGLFGKRHGVLEGHPRTGDLLPPLVHLGAAAPCGLAVIPSPVLTPEQLLACSFNMHKVTQHQLESNGSTYQASTDDFLVSDQVDFHPTDVLVDADGSILVIDTGGWYKLCCPTSHLYKPDVLGAIYRIFPANHRPPEDPRGSAIPWKDLTPKHLVSFLDDQRPAVRDRARRELAARGDASLAALRDALDGAGAERRLAAVWTLCRIATPGAAELVVTAVSDEDDEVAHAALRAASLLRISQALRPALKQLGARNPALRRVAAECCGRLGDAAAVPNLLEAAGRAGDRFERHAIIFALIEINAPRQTRVGLNAETLATRSAAAIALDQMPAHQLNPADVVPWLASDHAELRTTAIDIIIHRAQWHQAVASWLQGQFEQGAVEGGTLQIIAQRLANTSSIQAVLAQYLSDPDFPTPQKLAILKGLSKLATDRIPVVWRSAVESLLQSDSVALVAATIDWLHGREVPAAMTRAIWDSLKQIARRKQYPRLTRLRALSLAGENRPVLETDLFTFVLESLDSENSVPEQLAAVTVLRSGVLSQLQRRRLIQMLPALSPLALQQIIGAFARTRSPSEQLAVIEAVAQNPSRSAIPPFQLRSLFTDPTSDSKKRLEQLIAEISPEPARQRRYVDDLLKQLPNGDRRRGYAVFFSQKAACSTCHSIGYLGGNIGPDLTKVGQIRTERDILEAIVFPSASFVQSFEPVTLRTVDGRIVSGIIRNDTSESVEIIVAADRVERVAKDEIEAMIPGLASIMPAGIDRQLSKQELADLVAFLKNAR